MTDIRDTRRAVELLAPARDAATAIEAIKHGADAVYIGPPRNGARAAAANSLDDIAAVTDFAHRFDCRVYATVNTIVYDNELSEVEKMVWELYRRDVDAVIVQDMALLSLRLPPIALHASTQCDIRTPEKALWLQRAGFSQIVPARELSVEETARICAAVSVPVEVFVHGALCVSYSGDCYASLALSGRSANRGECAQVCRMPMTLVDADGNVLVADKHLLSLRDLNRCADIAALLDAGVSSFKIEGRLKDTAYVKNTVAAYRRAIDSAIEAAPRSYRRSSSGESAVSFTADLGRSFNRGFTSYFTRPVERGGALSMACLDTPKQTGEAIGTVRRCMGNIIELEKEATIANGDGMVWFNAAGVLGGFRVNRAQGRRIHLAKEVAISPGTLLYRNRDKAWDDRLAGDTAERSIDVEMTLRLAAGSLALDIAMTAPDGRTLVATASMPYSFVSADTPQQQRRAAALAKTGGTPYRVTAINDNAGNAFIAASLLSALRRKACDTLTAARSAGRRIDRRKLPAPGLPPLHSPAVSYHENIANCVAAEAYRRAGATAPERALEVDKKSITPGTTVMTTRYCIRRECGRCLRTSQGKQWKEPLSLRIGRDTFDLHFDCARCGMSLSAGRR